MQFQSELELDLEIMPIECLCLRLFSHVAATYLLK